MCQSINFIMSESARDIQGEQKKKKEKKVRPRPLGLLAINHAAEEKINGSVSTGTSLFCVQQLRFGHSSPRKLS